MNNESIRERVIRLIGEMRNRTTERGATPAEAASFAAKVAEWIEKYQIEEAELNAKTGGTNNGHTSIEVTENILRTGKKVFNPGTTQVVSGLATGMCCKVILLHKWYEGETEAVYGITGDTIDADYVCQLATTVIPALQQSAKLEGIEHGYEKAGLIRWSNQYLMGAGVEIKKRLEDERKQRSEVKQMEHQLSNHSTALVCITGDMIAARKRELVAADFRRRYPRTKTTHSHASHDHTAYKRGQEAGKSVGLHVGIEDKG